jgi:hypothetical protein
VQELHFGVDGLMAHQMVGQIDEKRAWQTPYFASLQ